MTVVIALVFLFLSNTAAADTGFELRPAVHPALAADVIVVFRPAADHALSSASIHGRNVSGAVMATERGYLDRPIVVPPGMVVSALKQGVRVKLFLKLSPDGQSYYVIGIFPPDYIHGVRR